MSRLEQSVETTRFLHNCHVGVLGCPRPTVIGLCCDSQLGGGDLVVAFAGVVIPVCPLLTYHFVCVYKYICIIVSTNLFSPPLLLFLRSHYPILTHPLFVLRGPKDGRAFKNPGGDEIKRVGIEKIRGREYIYMCMCMYLWSFTPDSPPPISPYLPCITRGARLDRLHNK